MFKNDRLGLQRQAHMDYLIKQLLLEKMKNDPELRAKLDADVRRLHEQFGYTMPEW